MGSHTNCHTDMFTMERHGAAGRRSTHIIWVVGHMVAGRCATPIATVNHTVHEWVCTRIILLQNHTGEGRGGDQAALQAGTPGNGQSSHPLINWLVCRLGGMGWHRLGVGEGTACQAGTTTLKNDRRPMGYD